MHQQYLPLTPTLIYPVVSLVAVGMALGIGLAAFAFRRR